VLHQATEEFFGQEHSSIDGSNGNKLGHMKLWIYRAIDAFMRVIPLQVELVRNMGLGAEPNHLSMEGELRSLDDYSGSLSLAFQ
jgi:hypothetical protein